MPITTSIVGLPVRETLTGSWYSRPRLWSRQRSDSNASAAVAPQATRFPGNGGCEC